MTGLSDPEKSTMAMGDKYERVRGMIGYELYTLLDDYFRDLAREIRLKAPLPLSPPTPTLTSTSTKKGKGKSVSIANEPMGDELELLEYYTKAYKRYSSGAAQINRLFAYLNRHFIMRAIDEGCGWISLADVVATSVLKGMCFCCGVVGMLTLWHFAKNWRRCRSRIRIRIRILRVVRLPSP